MVQIDYVSLHGTMTILHRPLNGEAYREPSIVWSKAISADFKNSPHELILLMNFDEMIDMLRNNGLFAIPYVQSPSNNRFIKLCFDNNKMNYKCDVRYDDSIDFMMACDVFEISLSRYYLEGKFEIANNAFSFFAEIAR